MGRMRDGLVRRDGCVMDERSSGKSAIILGDVLDRSRLLLN